MILDYYRQLKVHPLPNHRYRLLEPYTYITNEGHVILIPAGYITDGATIPQVLWSVGVPPNDSNTLPAVVVHDWLCSNAHIDGYNIEEFNYANKIFEEFLLKLNLNTFRVSFLVYGVKAYQLLRPFIKLTKGK